jgi:diguanylate cyclase (GGDEF)-like protein
MLAFSGRSGYNSDMHDAPTPKGQNTLLGAVRSPARLLRVFTLISLVSFVSIISLAGAGVYFIYRSHIIGDAEENAVRIGRAIFEQEQGFLLAADSDGRQTIGVSPQAFLPLDGRMRSYLRPLNIMKVKFFDRSRKIVYSTDHSLIGKIDGDNTDLVRALQGGVVSKIVKKGTMLDLAGEKRYDVDVVETYFPIVGGGQEPIGAFEIYVDVSQAFGHIMRVSFLSLAILSAVMLAVFGSLLLLMRRLTMQLSSAQSELERTAITDGLTGLFNRAHIMKRAGDELVRMTHAGGRRKGSDSMGFIMFDIDDFKRVNDEFGHFAGDCVLKETAARTLQVLRPYDFVGRYGGEEFLVVLPHTGCDETYTVSERIRRKLRETPMSAPGVACRVTASFGIACTTGEEAELADILRRADKGLYRAKRAGKDRTERIDPVQGVPEGV